MEFLSDTKFLLIKYQMSTKSTAFIPKKINQSSIFITVSIRGTDPKNLHS